MLRNMPLPASRLPRCWRVLRSRKRRLSATTDRATTAAPAAPSDASSLKGNWRASKLVGLNVYNDSNESLGSINDLLTDKSGDIKAVVIGVGGFLGVGEHLVAVPLDKVKFVDEPIAYTGAAGAPATGAQGLRARQPLVPRRPRRPPRRRRIRGIRITPCSARQRIS